MFYLYLHFTAICGCVLAAAIFADSKDWAMFIINCFLAFVNMHCLFYNLDKRYAKIDPDD